MLMLRVTNRRLFAGLLLLLSFVMTLIFIASIGKNGPKVQANSFPLAKTAVLRASDTEKARAVSLVASRVAQLQLQLDALVAAGNQNEKSTITIVESSTPKPTQLTRAVIEPPPPPPASFTPTIAALPHGPADPVPVLVVACCRAAYLRKTLVKLSSLLPPAFRIVVSQDGTDADVTQLLQTEFPSALRLQHTPSGHSNYEKIARHYGWALGQVFNRFEL